LCTFVGKSINEVGKGSFAYGTFAKSMSEDTHSHRWSSHDVTSYKPLHSHSWYSVYEASTILWMELLSLPWPCWWLDQHHTRELQPLWFLTSPLELEEDMMWNKLKWACKWAPTSHPLFIDLWNLITLFFKKTFLFQTITK
jgi:hypothetical protein